MLTFTFETVGGEKPRDLSGLTGGHITISGSGGNLTSKGKQPNQVLMIFPSIVELLDGVRRFLTDPNASRYHFVATDSSFQFVARKGEDKGITVSAEGKVLDTVQPNQLAVAIRNGLAAFLASQASGLTAEDPVADDLNSSVEEFGRAFNLARMI
jgi:hypothetical protein